MTGFGAWRGRCRTGARRYRAAPVTWPAVGWATRGLGPRAIPDGRAVATPGAAQGAAFMAALVVTGALARFRPTHLLSRPTRVAALPGLAVIGSMSVLSWVAEGWPFAPVLVTGALGLVALELVADELPTMLVALVEPMWWGLVWAGLGTNDSRAPRRSFLTGKPRRSAKRRPSPGRLTRLGPPQAAGRWSLVADAVVLALSSPAR